MSYTAVTQNEELEAASRALFANIRAQTTKTRQKQRIVFRPSHVDAYVYWSNTHRIWFAVEERKDHFWIPFGITKPQGSALRISVEINVPRRRKHRRAGLILLDQRGTLCLAHTGRVGGGIQGINRTTFLQAHGLTSEDMIAYDSGKAAILLGQVRDKRLLDRIAKFVREVARFRQHPPHTAQPVRSSKEEHFQPKFVGKTKRKARGEEQVQLLHDLVCKTLNDSLPPPRGYMDQRRDLFLKNDKGGVTILFEIKTDCSPYSIYTAVGQLLINGHTPENRKLRRVLVVPGAPDETTARVLSRYGIEVLEYEWRAERPIFAPEAVAKLLVV